MSELDPMPVLVLNVGSSTLKFAVYMVTGEGERRLLSGQADVVDEGHGAFALLDAAGAPLPPEEGEASIDKSMVRRIEQLLARHGVPSPSAIGHRIVHGGPRCRDHVLVDEAVMEQLAAAVPFAPLHLPAALALLDTARRHYPGVPHAVCLDTAFHADMPVWASTFPIPRQWHDLGLRRYGFHGLSCESIVEQFAGELPERLVIAHLGGGSSVTAVAAGRSIDTTMGLTPAGGVVMGSRSGDLDPGILIHLVREAGLDAARLEKMINHESGMQGVSGTSGDMRTLRRLADGDPDARVAIDMYCHSVRKHIGGMAAVLGGCDALVFTGGIGENDSRTREAVCQGLTEMGFGEAVILPSEEGRIMARHTRRMSVGADPPSVQ